MATARARSRATLGRTPCSTGAGLRRFGLGLALGFALLTAGPSASAAQAAPPELAGLDLLFEAELLAQGPIKSPSAWGNALYSVSFSIKRDLIAQGEGMFTGSRLRGTLDWSTLARHVIETSSSNVLVVGWLFSDNGAEIMYEARGYATPVGPARPDEWRVTAALRFEEPDAPYEWLAHAMGVWTGNYNARTGEGRYRAYVSRAAAASAAPGDGSSARSGTAPSAAQRASPLYYDDPVFAWRDNRDPESPRASPNGLVGQQIGSTRVMVAYGRPAARGRKIFGSLVPYGNVWRTGADEATTITLSGPLDVEGRTLEAGTYTLFAIPGASEWTVIVGRNPNQWGAGYNQADDVLRVTVPAANTDHRERLTFTFEEFDTDAGEASLVLRWETTKVALRVRER